MAGKRAVSEQLLEVLPPTPRDLLRANRNLAQKVFSAQRLPVSCPLSKHVILLARSKIKMRGGSLMCNYLRVVSAECGYNRTHRACMHAHLHHAPLRSVCTSGLSPMALLTSSFLPQQAMMAPYGHPGLQAMHSSDWDRVPLHGTGPPSTLTIYRPPGGSGMQPFMPDHGSAGVARMQSMLDGSSLAPQGPRPSLPVAPSAATASSAQLPALMDGSAQDIPAQSSAIDSATSAVPTAAENGAAELRVAPLSAAQLRDKVIAARVGVFGDRKASVSFFFF